MKRSLIHTSLLMLIVLPLWGQNNIGDVLKQHNTKSVPYISVQELAMPKTNAIILDAREPREYKISHIKNAIHVGYDFFSVDTITQKIPDKTSHIVVYCSLGIRSEVIAEKLKQTGYTNIYNLYGGIFEWKNNNFKLFDSNEKETDSVHVFDETWKQWLTKGIKVYD
ncbi:rhodanese-like domain-containing protein [Snuella sedimenti]|nr:rhodanese-like domain-containing protein [Snuella sedimenti]